MKKYILTLCVVFLSVYLNVANAQREIEAPDNGDEYIEDGYPGDDLDGDPIAGGDGPCRTCENIPNIRFQFNNDLFNSALQNEINIRRAAREGARRWYNEQTGIIERNLEAKFNRSFSSYNAAKDFLFTDSEIKNINRNLPTIKNKYARLRDNSNRSGINNLKILKVLKIRETEIKAGNIIFSAYPEFKIGNTPLRSIRDINTINREYNKAFSQFNADIVQEFDNKLMLKILANPAGLENEVLRNKNSYYNRFNEWDRLDMMQFLIHFEEFKRLTSTPYLNPQVQKIFDKYYKSIDRATPTFIEDFAKRNKGNEVSLFHPGYWIIIWKRDYRSGFLKVNAAKAKHEALKKAELARLLNSTPINVNSAVDYLVSELFINNPDQLKWLNENPQIAIEMKNFLTIIRRELLISTKSRFKDRIANGGLVEKMIRDLKLDAYKAIIYKDEKTAKKLLDFVRNNTPIRGTLNGEALAFIKEALEAIKNGGKIELEDRIFNFLEGKALCVYNKLKELNLFKSTINQFEQGNDYNLHLIQDYTKCRVTDEACTSASDFENGNITIYFRGTGNTNLDFAATILHEGIHAAIFRYVDRYKKGLDPIKKKELLDYYSDYKSQNGPTHATSEAQHQYMADRFVKPIARAIRKLDNNKHPLKFYMGYGWDGLRAYGYDDYRDDNGQYISLDKGTSTEYYINQGIVNDNSDFNNKECN